jgi:hypothetical protein
MEALESGSAEALESGPAEEFLLKSQPITAGVGGKLWRLNSAKGGAATAVFVPDAVVGAKDVNLLLWMHGNWGSPCTTAGKDIFEYVQKPLFALAPVVVGSGAPVVLVAPSMRWVDDEVHKFQSPKALNAFLEEVVKNLTDAGWSTPPNVGRLILAGHSRAYVVLDSLAAKAKDADSKAGALGKLTDVWSIDTMYAVKGDACGKWLGWAKEKPSVRFRVRFRRKSSTAYPALCLKEEVAVDPTVKNVVVTSSGFDEVQHCDMPKTHLPGLLKAAFPATAVKAPRQP